MVTGAGHGVGRAAALACAAQGGRVTAADIDGAAAADTVQRIEQAGGTAIPVVADIADPRQVEAMVHASVERFGRLDGAVNSAAHRGAGLERLAEVAVADFERAVAVGLTGVWLCMKQQIRRMLAQEPPGGRIVNLSSVNGLGGAPWAAPYAAAKAGVLALTKSAALDYADEGIRVNALAPGLLESASREAAVDGLGLDGEGRRRLRRHQLAGVPAGRFGLPEEVAEMAVWLLSEAPDYLTGATLTVDGGLTAPWR